MRASGQFGFTEEGGLVIEIHGVGLALPIGLAIKAK
jgi:hypothetical protein